jgi:hypothetical protein
MFAPPGGKPAAYTHRDGTPYTDLRRRAKPVPRLTTRHRE